MENLSYNNPYALEIERVWFDGKVVFAVESGEVEIEFDEHRVARGNKVAQEYQVVYSVELDEHGKLEDGNEPERVDAQYNITRCPRWRRTRRSGSSTIWWSPRSLAQLLCAPRRAA